MAQHHRHAKAFGCLCPALPGRLLWVPVPEPRSPHKCRGAGREAAAWCQHRARASEPVRPQVFPYMLLPCTPSPENGETACLPLNGGDAPKLAFEAVEADWCGSLSGPTRPVTSAPTPCLPAQFMWPSLSSETQLHYLGVVEQHGVPRVAPSLVSPFQSLVACRRVKTRCLHLT